MKLNLLDFSDYKAFLAEKITHEAALDRTYRTRLSEHVRCQPSYLSQVLNGKPDFTLEQAHRLCQFLAFDKVEARLFLLLVEKSRAGTVELKHFFTEQIDELKKDRFDFKRRLKKTDDIAEEDRHKYYSAWFYSAIYVILSIPQYQDLEAIARRLNLPRELVAETVRFLEESGLIESEAGRYRVTKKRPHLERSSMFIQRHHINWRSQALASAEKNLPGDMHYSTVAALSVADFEKIKEVFVSAIARTSEIIRPSAEEEIVAVTLDLFRL